MALSYRFAVILAQQRDVIKLADSCRPLQPVDSLEESIHVAFPVARHDRIECIRQVIDKIPADFSEYIFHLVLPVVLSLRYHAAGNISMISRCWKFV